MTPTSARVTRVPRLVPAPERPPAGPHATVTPAGPVAVTRGGRSVLQRRAALALTLIGLAMVPWVVYLHMGLPATAHASHWAWTWTGLDGLEGGGLLSTGLLLRRGDHRACLTAVVTAALLVADAWFDTMTAAPGADLAQAVVMAACAELPLAAACTLIAVRVLPRPGR